MLTRCMGALGACIVLATGCAPTTAVVNGQVVARKDEDFTGQPYRAHLRGAHPQPGGPSSGLKDYGGRIMGRVCGLETDYEVQHMGDRVELNGFLDTNLSAQIAVRDENGERHFTGNLGTAAGASTVDLHLTADRLWGRVARREFDLKANGDAYEGPMRWTSQIGAVAKVNGKDALWKMPASVQAAVLPALMTCNAQRIEIHNQGGLTVSIGVPPTVDADRTSSLYMP